MNCRTRFTPQAVATRILARLEGALGVVAPATPSTEIRFLFGNFNVPVPPTSMACERIFSGIRCVLLASIPRCD